MRIRSAITVLSLVLSLLCPLIAAAQNDNTETINDLNDEAARRVRRSQFDRALELYRQVAELDPAWADVWYNLGEVSRAADMHNDCVIYFSRYVYMTPESQDGGQVRRTISRCRQELDSTGTLTMTVQPESAQIAVNGIVLGRGTLEPLVVAAGSYEISASATDHVTWTETVALEDGAEESRTPQLEIVLFYGTMATTVEPDGATFSVDEGVIGITPLADPITLEAGQHLVTIQRDGYYDWTRRVNIEREEEYELDVIMYPVDD